MKALIGLVALLVVIAGCTQQVMEKQEVAPKEGMEGEWTPEEVAAMEKEEMKKKEKMMEGEWTPEQMAEMEKEGMMEGESMMASASTYMDWDKDAFDQAVKEGKIVLIDFAADWCGICKKEHPQLMAGFEHLNDPRFVGFRVHYKDALTTPEHDALAQQYQIPYQHTKVVIKDGKVVLKSPEAWTADRVVSELKKFA